ncbi:ATP-binding cassette domain-containing protein [Tomitella biformata]|uniref:ATP-binding cassette domain-containing protein n=1 Tax=Tomitella biformata TaxID=630403 RepID=UPI0004640FB4|nr:ATP-binding cassette domain-containing protein [Tomitella biformata]
MTYAIRATGIRKAYGDRVVLDGVDLTVETGTIFALLGPNGAGKTTMVNILATLARPDAGQATVAGHELLADPVGVRRSISLTGQYAAVDELLTAEENLVMMARLHRYPRAKARARAAELLVEFDLAEHAGRRVKAFSGGLRRRLDLAVSLVNRPTLVFLDEPTTGLDPRSREQVWATARGLVAAGTTVFLTTQYLEEADRLADRIAMLDGGRIVVEGTADELKSSLAGEIVRLEFDASATFERARRVLGARVSGAPDESRRTLEVATDGTAERVRVLLADLSAAGAAAASISLHRPSLDDVFLALTGASHNQKMESVA